jgi:hypothetical protein
MVWQTSLLVLVQQAHIFPSPLDGWWLAELIGWCAGQADARDLHPINQLLGWAGPSQELGLIRPGLSSLYLQPLSPLVSVSWAGHSFGGPFSSCVPENTYYTQQSVKDK